MKNGYTIILVLLLRVFATADSISSKEFNNYDAKFSSEEPCLKSIESCIPPSSSEVQAKIEYATKWKALAIAHIEGYKTDLKKIDEYIATYESFAEKSSGDAASTYKKIADALKRSRSNLTADIDADLDKIKNNKLIDKWLEIKKLGSRIQPKELNKLLSEADNAAKDFRNIVVGGYGREIITRFNMNTGDKESHTVLLDSKEKPFGLLSRESARRSYHSALKLFGLFDSEGTQCGVSPTIPVDDTKFVHWLVGDGAESKVKIKCKETSKTQRARNAIPKSWYFAEPICPEFDEKTKNLTVYYTKHDETSMSVYETCSGDAMGNFLTGQQATVVTLEQKYKESLRKDPKAAEAAK